MTEEHGAGSFPLRINGHLAHAQVDDGVGPDWVFVNSLGTDFRVWEPLLPALGQRRCIRYDKRGHGLSELTQGPFTIPQLAEDLAGVLEELAKGPAVIVGLSIGGMIAQQLYQTRPELVRGLVLMDTAPKIGTDEVWNERIAAVREGGIEALADAVMERWFAPATHRSRADEVARWRTMLTRTPAEGYIACSEAIREADLTAAAAQISVPTLCIVGAHDGSTPPDVVEAMAKLIPGASFEVVADAGHLPAVEQPRAVAQLLERFARNHDLS